MNHFHFDILHVAKVEEGENFRRAKSLGIL